MNFHDSKTCCRAMRRLIISLAILSLIILCGIDQVKAQSQWTTNGNNIYNNNSGNVGIGTPTPLEILHLLNPSSISNPSGVGQIALQGGLNNSGFIGHWNSGGLYLSNNRNVRTGNNFNTSSIGAQIVLGNSGDGNNGDITFHTISSGITGTPLELLRVKSTGNIGIGTATPGERLVTIGNILAGNITSHTQLYSTFDSQSPVIMELGYGTATSNITPMPVFILSKNLTSTNNGVGLLAFANSAIANGSDKRLTGISTFTDGAINSGAMVFHTSALGTFTERMRITSAGNVGIGTTTPGRPLEVMAPNGDAARLYRNANSVGFGVNMTFAFNNSSNAQVDYAGVHGIIQSNTAGAENGNLVFSTVASGSALTERMRILASGNVGIGTSSPDARFQVHHSSANTNLGNIQLTDLVIGLRNTSNTNGSMSLISFQDAAGFGNAQIGAVQTDQTNHNADLVFLSRNAAAFGERMRIRSNGSVGIGTAAPAYKLDVQGGQVNASGGICIAGNCKTAWSQVGGISQWTTYNAVKASISISAT